MSAYLCTDAHISALAGYAVKHNLPRYVKNLDLADPSSAAELARRLHAVNLASVNFRYRENNSDSFTFDARAARCELSAVQVIKAAHCFNYQACEPSDWDETAEARLIQAIISSASHDLPGYNEAAWGVPQDCAAKPAPVVAAPALVVVKIAAPVAKPAPAKAPKVATVKPTAPAAKPVKRCVLGRLFKRA